MKFSVKGVLNDIVDFQYLVLDKQAQGGKTSIC
jgi:hypothetical protein